VTTIRMAVVNLCTVRAPKRNYTAPEHCFYKGTAPAAVSARRSHGNGRGLATDRRLARGAIYA